MIHSRECGGARIDVLHAGEICYDGGVTFGAVPRGIWSKWAVPDEAGRIRMSLRPVLIRIGGKRILVDAGLGGHQNKRLKEMYSLEGSGTVLASLGEAGVDPVEVDFVIFTHLHIDHMGGALDGKGTIFPHARFVVQKGEWAAATHTNAMTRGAYSPPDLALLEKSGRLMEVEGDCEILPGVRLVRTGGHTRCHQIVLVGSGEERVMLPGDLLPSSHHFSLPCIAAVDLDREQSFLQKSTWMKRASNRNWLTTLYHEAGTPVGRIMNRSSNRYEFERAGEGGSDLDS